MSEKKDTSLLLRKENTLLKREITLLKKELEILRVEQSNKIHFFVKKMEENDATKKPLFVIEE
jgi:hypothetical protein